MKKLGFTLAEVLLTLAIIGVVAALTIPAVITKVTQDQYVVALKKAYNTLKSVEREAIQDNGEMQLWTLGADSEATFNKFFKPHFDILKDCGVDTDDGCFFNDSANEYKDLKGTTVSPGINGSTYARIITSDGLAYAYTQTLAAMDTKKSFGSFIVDVNGKKKPNKWGRDIFQFEVFPSTLGVKPSGAFDATTAASITSTALNAECVATSTGKLCAAKVLAEGSMEY